MRGRDISWFKHGIPYDAKFTGFKIDNKYKVPTRCWNRIVVFIYEDDHKEACRQVVIEAAKFGYMNVTVDKIVRLGR